MSWTSSSSAFTNGATTSPCSRVAPAPRCGGTINTPCSSSGRVASRSSRSSLIASPRAICPPCTGGFTIAPGSTWGFWWSGSRARRSHQGVFLEVQHSLVAMLLVGRDPDRPPEAAHHVLDVQIAQAPLRLLLAGHRVGRDIGQLLPEGVLDGRPHARGLQAVAQPDRPGPAEEV